MPEMKEIARGLRQRLKTTDGRHFFGRISSLPEATGRMASFYTPRRLLNVHPSCQIAAGDIIYNTDGRVMLCAWAGDDENRTGVYSRVFKLFDLEQNVSWKRMVTDVDPVTNLPQNALEQELGPIWCSIEVLAQTIDTSTTVPQSRYRMLCAADLRINDVINSQYRVKRVERSLGITLAEVA